MSVVKRSLSSVSLTILRLSLSAWVGAAALFVITSVAEQVSPDFDSRIRDQLATIRFPLYYQFGFGALGVSILSGLAALKLSSGCQKKRVRAAVIFASLSLAGAAADYVWVYLPLQELISPPGKAREQGFVELHERSRHANEVHITLALLAAVFACSPEKPDSEGTCSTDAT